MTSKVIFSSSFWDFQQQGIHVAVPGIAVTMTDMRDIKLNHFNINLPYPYAYNTPKYPSHGLILLEFTRNLFECPLHFLSVKTAHIILENLVTNLHKVGCRSFIIFACMVTRIG